MFLKIQSDVTFKGISSNNYHTMGLDTGGNIWSTGCNEHGELGLNDNIDCYVLTKIPNLSANNLFGKNRITGGKIKGAHTVK